MKDEKKCMEEEALDMLIARWKRSKLAIEEALVNTKANLAASQKEGVREGVVKRALVCPAALVLFDSKQDFRAQEIPIWAKVSELMGRAIEEAERGKAGRRS